jgi:hypothetical protein
VVVLELLLGDCSERKLVEQVVPQKQLLAVEVFTKDSFTRSMDPFAQLVPLSGEHELEQLCDRLGILLDLPFRIWVENSEACIDVPLVGVDAQGNVHLDVLNTADVA